MIVTQSTWDWHALDQTSVAKELVKIMGELLGINELWLFILSGLLLNVTPGPDQTLKFRRRAGSVISIGSAS